VAFVSQWERRVENSGWLGIVFVVMLNRSGRGSAPSLIQICQSTSSPWKAR